ncbi:MAG: outer membrane beta-barrel protein [Rhodospirillales bacterium]|nr:outer membrane beta-barrel protein [Rhodospirillales bacterium]
MQIDGGPLGTLKISGGVDGYFFAQSGASGSSVVGPKSNGANISAFMIQAKKTTGPIQFTIQLAEYTNINLGANKPKEINGNMYTTGPLRAAYITLPLTDDFSISAGQLDSLEGYESAFAWNNPVALRTVIASVENSESRGVSASYNQGPFSGTVIFGDGYDTGVFNYLQFLTSYDINADSNLNVFGGVALGVTGPNSFAYGSGGSSNGGANGVGGQGQLANVNSNMLGGWYSTVIDGLNLTSEVQYQYAKPLHRYADVTSGGVSDNIAKETSNLGVAEFAEYQFPGTDYSIGSWAEYATSHGSGAQDNWFVAPNAELVGFAVAPTWQHGHIYSRLNAGYVHLLNQGQPVAGYGNSGTGKNQVVGTLELGLVF